MKTEVKDVVARLRARRVPGKWSDTVTRDPLLEEAADLLEAAESRATAAEGRVALREEALGKLVDAEALAGVRSLVAGWNGETRPDGPYAERHPARRGAVA